MKMTTTKKSRWGIGIAVVYGAFVVLMIAAVVASRFQRSDLVSRDYYEQEVKYQDQIDRVTRTTELGHQIVAGFDRQANQIVIAYPEAVAREQLTGRLSLFRPSNAAYDRSYEISLDEHHRQLISCDRLPRGLWKLKFAWKIGADELYTEQSIELE